MSIENINTIFCERLAEAMKMKGVKASELAERSGLSKARISQYLNGVYVPKSKGTYAIAKALDISETWLMGYDTPMERATPSSLNIETSDIHMVPVFDSVSAGFGTYASDYIVDYAPAIIKAGAEDYIYINVKGDSMFPKIEEGDRILVRRQTSVDSGSIAVVLIDGEEGVVKKVTYGDDWIELHSINPMYPIRRFEGQEVMRLKVLGLVKQIVKEV